MSQQNTTNYFQNFDDARFKDLAKNEFNRLIDDQCAIQARNNDNSKKLKFITTNHIDLIDAKSKLNFFGIGMKDQLFVPSESIDNYSNLLNGSNGGTLTNCNVRNGFGQLPTPTLPYKGQAQHGDVVVEDNIRNYIEVRKNACLPRESNFEQRSFTIFNQAVGVELPQAEKSVETPQAGFQFGRLGMGTRYTDRFSKTKPPVYTQFTLH